MIPSTGDETALFHCSVDMLTCAYDFSTFSSHLKYVPALIPGSMRTVAAGNIASVVVKLMMVAIW